MHGERNYPLAKTRSNWTCRCETVRAMPNICNSLRRICPRFGALAGATRIYLAGVDVAAGDRYGKLALSESGVAQRDRFVIETVRRAAFH